ncbi:hypothetical protein BM449_11435 [Synechococcus sp. SynAce01]|nr:hypothetical protein BM449_11385 [Synechococcus sp. SynAce01]APD48741.1 hypothetical protein BM449_11435 [Synechococcus sp. SynAce01]
MNSREFSLGVLPFQAKQQLEHIVPFRAEGAIMPIDEHLSIVFFSIEQCQNHCSQCIAQTGTPEGLHKDIATAICR